MPGFCVWSAVLFDMRLFLGWWILFVLLLVDWFWRERSLRGFLWLPLGRGGRRGSSSARFWAMQSCSLLMGRVLQVAILMGWFSRFAILPQGFDRWGIVFRLAGLVFNWFSFVAPDEFWLIDWLICLFVCLFVWIMCCEFRFWDDRLNGALFGW